MESESSCRRSRRTTVTEVHLSPAPAPGRSSWLWSLFQSGGSRRLRGSRRTWTQTCPPCFQRSAKDGDSRLAGHVSPWGPWGGVRSFQTLVFSVSVLQLDSAVCQDMSVSDTDASTWTDTGTFNLSEGHTPQTENSEGAFDDQRGVEMVVVSTWGQVDPHRRILGVLQPAVPHLSTRCPQ